ncbi:hypothetical protein AYO21_02259 [Fonsecaea monophora]|uniref:Uncharacterized protein n=1 Tax=Fonsecaea monophora TaxID=254056 RepID=A0A177FHB0_9EURO|nr:hypothetical protein AYO21_02259 [Fonsecaea monophora]OAG43673.1 hypothetical protein AYO21_02259 [Fonsecaea monophora]
MSPYFRRLLDGGINDPLEIRSLPFYGIGGAGTHFPTVDKSGNPVLPSNTRLPRRVLGILAAAEPEDGNTSGQDRERYLEIFGYGGQWFDCRDVEGYLKDKGVDLDMSSLYPALNNTSTQIPASYRQVHTLSGMDSSAKTPQPGGSVHDLILSTPTPCHPSDEFHISDTTVFGHPDHHTDYFDNSTFQRGPRYSLDVQKFFNQLLSGLVLLGRAPGFRRTEVEAAFEASLMPRILFC